MITGRKIQIVTRESILKKIHPLSIYEFYMPDRVRLNKTVSSPFRKDNNPSFIISDRGGRYHHFDYGDDSKRGGCIDFVMQMRGLNFNDALELINYDINSNEMTHLYEVDHSNHYLSEKEVNKGFKKDVSIIVKSKKFTKEAINYWNEYYISKQMLEKEKVYLIDKFYINHQRVGKPEDEMAFAYLLQNEYFKTYRPFTTNKSLKWRYNGPNDYIESLYEVEKGGKLLITKAKKDRMSISNIYKKVCNVQCETTAAFNKENVEYINNNFDEVYVNYDCDGAGIKASWQITSTFGWKHINVPYSYLKHDIKDFAGMIRKDGLENLNNYFTSKGLIS